MFVIVPLQFQAEGLSYNHNQTLVHPLEGRVLNHNQSLVRVAEGREINHSQTFMVTRGDDPPDQSGQHNQTLVRSAGK